eukprot:CAMPEP_0119320088 /NCGR_PEP_ID=MMETSP1333-20130426/51379_1 /TAXON_ID=418940 /ORGANISM="Scyphosphaera apsteinii, Strain RCC1455" /LENGTH=422 /DNA_ID=CAMNT_0007326699 /DNA_START=129 /DNA_END=1394 /DNA_ORIENTATION=+
MTTNTTPPYHVDTSYELVGVGKLGGSLYAALQHRALAHYCLRNHSESNCLTLFTQLSEDINTTAWQAAARTAFQWPSQCQQKEVTYHAVLSAHQLNRKMISDYDRRHEVLFVRIPKAGGEFIIAALTHGVPNGGESFFMHVPARVSWTRFPNSGKNRHTMISIVRDPFERTFSWFAFCLQGMQAAVILRPRRICQAAQRLYLREKRAIRASCDVNAAHVSDPSAPSPSVKQCPCACSFGDKRLQIVVERCWQVECLRNAFEVWLFLIFSDLEGSAPSSLSEETQQNGKKIFGKPQSWWISKSQTWWLADKSGRLAPTYLLRTESLSDDWDRVGRCALGICVASVEVNRCQQVLKHVNRSHGSIDRPSLFLHRNSGLHIASLQLPIAAYYTHLSALLVRRNFQQDLDIFFPGRSNFRVRPMQW